MLGSCVCALVRALVSGGSGLASRVHASIAVYYGVRTSGPCVQRGENQLFVTRIQVCRDLDLGEFWVRLLFPVVVFLIEERNQFVYFLRLGFLALENSYYPLLGCFQFLFGFQNFRGISLF